MRSGVPASTCKATGTVFGALRANPDTAMKRKTCARKERAVVANRNANLQVMALPFTLRIEAPTLLIPISRVTQVAQLKNAQHVHMNEVGNDSDAAPDGRR